MQILNVDFEHPFQPLRMLLWDRITIQIGAVAWPSWANSVPNRSSNPRDELTNPGASRSGHLLTNSGVAFQEPPVYCG